MVLAIGTGAKEAAMMHLFTHAFFKAGLFLGAGAIIHSLHHVGHQVHKHFDVQDIRNLGGLRKYLPITFITFILCGAALAGLPMFSGFLSKDAILTSAWMWKGPEFSWKWIIAFTAFIIPFLTVIYTFRMIWFVFFGKNRTAIIIGQPINITEVPAIMRLPLILLSAGSFWLIVSLNPFDFSGWLYTSLHTGKGLHLPAITLFSIVWVLSALVFAYFYFKSRPLGINNTPLSKLALNSFYLDRLYHKLITAPLQKISMLTEKIDLKWIDGAIHIGVYAQVTFAHFIGWVDKYIIDGTVNGMAKVAGGVGTLTRSFQGGKIQLYIFWAVLGIIIFIISMLL